MTTRTTSKKDFNLKLAAELRARLASGDLRGYTAEQLEKAIAYYERAAQAL